MSPEDKPEIKGLRVSEIFYSLQGEGQRTGEPSVFIRLQGCSAKHACYASGIRCDTEFESGKEMSLEYLHRWIQNNAQGCRAIIWTGGEPLDQLTDDHTRYFKDLGYYQCLETSGLKSPVDHLDYIVISPKVAEHVIIRSFADQFKSTGKHCQEIRWVRHKGQDIPQTNLTADYYCLSPHFNGSEIDPENLNHVIQLCLNHPTWRLSLQNHKIWRVL